MTRLTVFGTFTRIWNSITESFVYCLFALCVSPGTRLSCLYAVKTTAMHLALNELYPSIELGYNLEYFVHGMMYLYQPTIKLS